jgi:prepilin-type N-terminal cleavage/methylation domain-containing protein
VNSRGMTLIEVLISLVILSSVTVFTLQALSKSAEVQRTTEFRRKAHFFALTRLAELEARVAPETEIEKTEKGRFRDGPDTFDWEIVTAPHGLVPEEEAPDPKEVPVLLELGLSVAWEQGLDANSVQLRTLSFHRPAKE